MDYEPEELKRKITINTAFNTLTWKKHQINIIDTPGDFNFVSETKTSMQGGDAALVVVDAVDAFVCRRRRCGSLPKSSASRA